MTSETQKRDLMGQVRHVLEQSESAWAQAVVFQRDHKSPTGWKVGS